MLEKYDHLFVSSILVSPPLNYFSFNWNNLKNKVDLVISGDRDHFCDVEILRKQAAKINSLLEIIPETDHFYSGKEKELIDVLNKFIAQI